MLEISFVMTRPPPSPGGRFFIGRRAAQFV